MTPTIGGSEAAAALGVDPYRSRVALWLDKTGQLAPDTAGEAAQWGTRLQPVIASAVEERGYNVIPAPFDMILSDKHPFMHARPDGYVALDGARGVLEIKTAGIRMAHEWNDGQAPISYVIQCHHYMIVTGLDRALLAVLIGGQKLETRELRRDDALCEMIVAGEQEFARMVEERTPPAPDGSASTDAVLKQLYGKGDPDAVCHLDASGVALVESFRSLRDASKAAKTHAEKAEQEIKMLMGDAIVAMHDGAPVASWKPITSNRLDQGALKEARPEVYAEFVRPQTYRRFTA